MSLLWEGLHLATLGIGGVFIFLLILITVTRMMTVILEKIVFNQRLRGKINGYINKVSLFLFKKETMQVMAEHPIKARTQEEKMKSSVAQIHRMLNNTPQK